MPQHVSVVVLALPLGSASAKHASQQCSSPSRILVNTKYKIGYIQQLIKSKRMQCIAICRELNDHHVRYYHYCDHVILSPRFVLGSLQYENKVRKDWVMEYVEGSDTDRI